MIRFECDYLEGAHPRILEALTTTNFEQTPGYGTDTYCEKARSIIKEKCNSQESDVHFLVGGTQTNTTVIASILRPHQGVLCASTGHINVHETGAIEATGHKVMSIPSDDGKITALDIQNAYESHFNDDTAEHMVQPGMVYISHPTENGTLYTKKELEAISYVCHKLSLPLFLDGARLGYGLTADGNDVTLEDIARLCDVFYIGGTKVGALFGEAVVITNSSLKKDFRYFIKQNGGMLAKGRLLGIQFTTLLENNLYFEIASHANNLALKIRDAFESKGCSFRYDSITNQQFPIIPDEYLEKLKGKYSFSFWEKTDENHTAVRFCTSWATKEEDVETLISDIIKL
ncbi:MAG: Low specificity L-threonine aldolase [Clostridium butyricum DORA_1]|nr:MAG: Low specificity L-threonine aldolase [Clostridium butyricum DORA_1]MDU1507254.1 low specificity L-threonine aldolase [Clostridium butyricum]MDU4799733.1 low specificity L-threonine aldolase [Clostridium butyricum]